jgi:hypothetical protein
VVVSLDRAAAQEDSMQPRTTMWLSFGSLIIVLSPLPVTRAEAQDDPKLKLWIDSKPQDTFSCSGLTYRLVDYHRDDDWLGHVFDLQVTNHSDAAARFDPAGFAALLSDGTQRSYPGTEELAELSVNGYKGKHELDSQQKQDRKRMEIKSRRDLTAENILPGASSVKRIALGPSPSGGIAIGGRAAEALKEYRAADIPLTLFCNGQKVGVVSKPIKP